MIQERTFRGHPYKIECSDSPQVCHPSWFSFDDESDVRERDWNIQKGDIVMDVGAAYGSYTLTALAVGAEHIYAWSPQGPPNEEPERELMAKSLALNGWANKCDIYSWGVFDKSGWLNASTQEFHETAPEPHGDIIAVETLDDWNRRVRPERIDWMKLDVEGAEVDVLRGAEELIRKFRPRIHTENHLFKRATICDEVRTILAGHGYHEDSTHPYHAISHSRFDP
jgi:FkbM family methyltransferase